MKKKLSYRGSYFSYAITYFAYFFAMGTMVNMMSLYLTTGLGKTDQEILAEIGAPQTIIQHADGSTLRIWQEDGYSISLLFDERGLCLGVDDEQD